MTREFVYSIRHITQFIYDEPVFESVMDVRLHPIEEDGQKCHHFELLLDPPTHLADYTDYMGNKIHHFNIPGNHNSLTVTAKSIVQVFPRTDIPLSLPESAWADLERDIHARDFWEMIIPSHFTRPTPALQVLAAELNVVRRDDPLSLVREINHALYNMFDYVPASTTVDSLIDVALKDRRGVCQDFTHIMISLLRHVGIPARYVSGYLFHHHDPAHTDVDRSTEGASHAWVEAYFPGLGWIGFDPTNNRLACERHIKVAVGRDYRDVPPTRGMYKGDAKSRLDVSVQIARTKVPLPDEWAPELPKAPKPIQRSVRQIQYQQQQQQQ